MGDEGKKEKPKRIMGRRRIDSKDRQRFSKRAALGDISIVRDNFKCKFCHHEKGIEFNATNSPKFGKIKCAKCKRVKE